MQINLNINKNNCTKLDFSHFRKKVKAVHDPAKLTTTMLWCWEWLSLCCSVVTRVGWVVDRMFLAVSRLVTIAIYTISEPLLFQSLDIYWVLCIVCNMQDNFTHFIMYHFHIFEWSVEVNFYSGTWKP